MKAWLPSLLNRSESPKKKKKERKKAIYGVTCMASKVFYGWTCRAYLGSTACSVLTTGIDRQQWPWRGWLVKALHVPAQGDENEASVCNDLCMSREWRPQRQIGGEIKSFLCSFRRGTAASHAQLLNVGSVFEGKIKKRERSEWEWGKER